MPARHWFLQVLPCKIFTGIRRATHMGGSFFYVNANNKTLVEKVLDIVYNDTGIITL